jgi:16S rRNA (cytosine967-C5)-methyltransferase
MAAAARAIAAVVPGGRNAELALERGARPAASASSVRAVTLGSLRWYLRLAPMIARLQGGRRLVPVLQALLIAALHQLEYSQHPSPVVVASAVEAARLLGQPRAAALVNALLRRYLREREGIAAALAASEEWCSAHPGWLLSALRASYPQHWPGIVSANNAHPPMTLRVDVSRLTRAHCLERLQQAGLAARPIPWTPGALQLEVPQPVQRLPGFDAGLVSVQDAGAQLAALLLAPRPGERVLDACAAPGGKTGALLEAAGGPIRLTALDIDAARMERVAQNLARLRREARLVTADLCSDLSWWDGERFDRILLDVPCSGTGVIRRHPDIRLLRRPGDIAAMATAQRRLLEQALGLLRPGALLLYATCSLLPEENEGVVNAVLAAHPAVGAMALVPPVEGVPWQARACGVQLLPGDDAQTDGFYYASLTVT